MSLLEVLHSLDSSFSGTLDDTLLMRLASCLSCSNKSEHAKFWINFEASCPTSFEDFLHQLFKHMTTALRLETLCHPTIVKVVFVLLERYLPQIAQKTNLLNVVHTFALVGLTKLTSSDMHHALMDGFCVLLEGQHCKRDSLQCILETILSDDILQSTIDIYTSSSSIFVHKIVLEFLAHVINLHDQLNLNLKLPLFVAKLMNMFTFNSILACDLFSAVLANAKSADSSKNMLHDFMGSFESILLSSFSQQASLKHISIHIFVFYLSWNHLSENSKSEIISVQQNLSSSVRTDVLFHLIRLASNRSVQFNMTHPSIDSSIVRSFETSLLRAFIDKDTKLCRRFYEIIALQKSPSLISEEVLIQLFPYAKEWMMTSDLVPRFFSTLNFNMKQKIEVVRLLHSQLADDPEEKHLMALESLCIYLMDNDAMDDDLFSGILNSLKPCVKKECFAMDKMTYSLFYCHLVAAMATEEALDELEQLLNYQKNCMVRYIEVGELQLFPCFFLDTALKLISVVSSKKYEIPSTAIDILLILCHANVTGNCISSEFRELLICLCLRVLFYLEEDSETFKSVKSIAMTISTSLFDFPLEILSSTLSSLFIKAASNEGYRQQVTSSLLETLATVTLNIANNGTLDWSVVDDNWLAALGLTLIQSKLGTDLLTSLKSRLQDVHGVCLPCVQCGESLYTLLEDILIAKEMPTKIDCIGD